MMNKRSEQEKISNGCSTEHEDPIDGEWKETTEIEIFFRTILPPIGFNDKQVKQKIEIAKRLKVFNLKVVKLIEKKWNEYFGDVVGSAIQQALKTSESPIKKDAVPTQLEKDILEIKNTLKKLVASNSSVSFSKISLPDWDNDFLCLDLLRRDVQIAELKYDVEKDIKGYSWTEASKDMQMEGCFEWLSNCIPLPENLRYVDVHTFTKRYMLKIGKHTYKGGTDILITPTWASVEFQSAIAVIELKKQQDILANKEQCITQVEAQLIAASNVSSFPVLAVLTDLNDYWFFTWFPEKGHIFRCTYTSARDGIAFLNQFVHTAEIPNPKDVTQKLPQKFIFPGCIACKFPPSRTPSQDVANELDLLDMVSPADQMEILSRYALQRLSYYS